MARLDDAEARGRTAVRAVLDAVPRSAPVVVAVSGGTDSLALAACAAFVASRDPVDVTALVVDHGLQAGSDEVAARAVAQVRGLGLRATSTRVQVGTDGGPEAAARAARREALLRAAGPRGVVLLAHTLDDQAETVLLGLGRGSGPRSIAGMRRVDRPWLRPFLDLRRTDTERICAVHGLEPWQDPHNTDPSYRRVRVRREALPLLEDVLDGGVAAALARTADQVRADADLLDRLATDATTDHVPALAALDPALRTRVLRRLALAAGAAAGELSARHVAALDRLVVDRRGGRTVELPGGVTASRRGERLVLAPTPVAR
ncbi:MAG: tRNA lysidine(34) synthetase TilS [Aeromicrobium erythreum]